MHLQKNNMSRLYTDVLTRLLCYVCVYLWYVDSVRGVRQISWYVTGAIKVVALDTAHEQHNDFRLVLISLHLALSRVPPILAVWLGSELQHK